MFKRTKRLLALAAGSAALLAPAAIAFAAPAGAATSSAFTLYHNGDSTAVLNAVGQPVLTAGTDSGTSAQVQVVNPPAQAPTTAPAFTTSGYHAGDPRWVIELHNGQYLFGNPAQASTSSDPSTWTWADMPSGKTGTYTAMLAAAQAGGLDDWVTAAFIIEDSGESGTPVTLTNISYDGQTLAATQAGAVTGYKGNCLAAGGNSSAAVLTACDSSQQNQGWTFDVTQNTGWGTQVGYLQDSSGNCLNVSGYAGKGGKVIAWACNGGANEVWQYWPKYKEYSVRYGGNTWCLNDPAYSTANGTQQIVWSCPDTANEQYTLPGQS